MIKIKYLLIILLIIISVLNCEEDNERNMKSIEFKGWIFFNADMKRYRYIDITIPLESGDVNLSGSNSIIYERKRKNGIMAGPALAARPSMYAISC